MSEEVRIAHITSVVDGRSQSGTARIARELIQELSKNSLLKQYLIHFDPVEEEIYKLENVTEILIPRILKHLPGSRFISFVIFCLLHRQSLNALKLDVVHWHVLRVYPFFWLLPAKKVVVTIHDAGVYVLPGVNTISTRLFRLNLRLFRRRISSIVVVSETAKLELISVAPWFKNQIEVMPLATRICKASPKRPPNLNGTQRYILCVSRWQPHKNILTFLLAYQEARVELGKKCPALIVVGKPRNDHDEDSKRIIGILNEVSTKTIHEVSESELSFLHRNSLFSIFPSLHEGFGLAVLESMVSGKMVLVHEGTATSEVLNIGELSINMRDTKAIKESIIKFSSDDKLLSEYAQLAKANSERYSWQKSALAIQNIYLKRPSC